MKGPGWGLISVALGIAVEVSGVTGVVVAVLAWTAVGAGVILLFLPLLRQQRKPSTRPKANKPRKRPLDRELQLLGRQILAFLYLRDVEGPGWDSSESTLRHPVRASRMWRAVRAYERDTISIHRQKFSPDVRRLVRQIGPKHLGRNEARGLLYPRDVYEAEIAAQRLIEIGEHLRSRRKGQVA